MSDRVRVLVVEDDPIARRLVLAALGSLRFDVRTAPDAVTALARIATHHPDIVLVDIGLTGVSGLELARFLAHMHLAEDLPVVALSAFDLPEHRAAATDAGLDGFIAKPIDTRTFAEEVLAYVAAGTRGARRRPALRPGARAQPAPRRRRRGRAAFLRHTPVLA